MNKPIGDHQSASNVPSAVEDVLLTRPWAVNEAGFSRLSQSLPADSPLRRVERRNSVAQAIADGQDVPASVAAEYPDIVQHASLDDLPAWMLTRLRNSDTTSGGRYVYSLNALYFVKPVASNGQVDYMVMRALDPEKDTDRPILNCTVVEPYEADAALEVYHWVERFVADPKACADRVRDLLADPAPPAPRPSLGMGRRGLLS